LGRADFIAHAVKRGRGESLPHKGARGRVQKFDATVDQRLAGFDLAHSTQPFSPLSDVDSQTYYPVGCNILLGILRARTREVRPNTATESEIDRLVEYDAIVQAKKQGRK